MDARSLQVANAKAENRRMVSKSSHHLQRCHGLGTPRNMGPSAFFHVTAAPRHHRNAAPNLGAHGKCARIRPLARSAEVELSDAHSIMEAVKALPTRRLLELAGFGWEQAAGFALIRR